MPIGLSIPRFQPTYWFIVNMFLSWKIARWTLNINQSILLLHFFKTNNLTSWADAWFYEKRNLTEKGSEDHLRSPACPSQWREIMGPKWFLRTCFAIFFFFLGGRGHSYITVDMHGSYGNSDSVKSCSWMHVWQACYVLNYWTFLNLSACYHTQSLNIS